MNLKKQRILVVVAHPDDDLLGCGATLIKAISNKSLVKILFLGEGVSSRFGIGNEFSKKSIDAKNIMSHDTMVSTAGADRGYLESSINFSLKYEKYGFSLAFNKRTFSSHLLEDHLHYNRTHTDTQYTIWRSFYLFGIKNKIFLKNRLRNTSSNYNWVEDLKTFDKYNLEHVIYF